MNRHILITAGIVIILLVFSIWLYLLVFGAPKETQEVFTNLGIMPAPGEEVIVVPQATSSTQLALGGSPLQQLGTRSVAGFAFASSTDNRIRYVERGTGYVYEIDTTTGAETQISRTTFPQTAEAIFSPQATVVALVSYNENVRNVLIGRIVKDEEMKVSHLPEDAQNIVFSNEDTVLFSISDATGTKGYKYNITTLEKSMVFSIDLTNARVLWGPTVYIQPQPSEQLFGALYAISDISFSPISSTGSYGFVAFANAQNIVTTHIADGRYISEAVYPTEIVQHGLAMIPEKCVFDTLYPNQTWCAVPLGAVESDYLNAWYKGTRISKDLIWHTDLHEDGSTLIADLSELSGRTIDVSGIRINQSGDHLLFKNKIDQTLWLYLLQR